MKDRQRWLPFLILNIFVSAAVTGAILFWYDRTYRQALFPSVFVAAQVSVEDAVPAVTFDPEEEIAVEIINVIGKDTLDIEVVLVRYNGSDELNLTGWRLVDEDDNIFVFPSLTLYSNKPVQIHSAIGNNTATDLYWGLRQSVWESGEEVSLIDPQGTERASYKVP